MIEKGKEADLASKNLQTDFIPLVKQVFNKGISNSSNFANAAPPMPLSQPPKSMAFEQPPRPALEALQFDES